MRPILHIGLGKAGTSYLQEYFFPNLLNYSKYFYWKENKDLTKQIFIYRNKMVEKQGFERVKLPDNVLVSLETLMCPSGWDPAYYEKFADLNLKAFGSNCVILITIRAPYDWLRSNYVRNIGKLNIIPKSQFYVSNENYRQYKLNRSYCPNFALEKFSYNRIYDIYNKRFSKVILIKYKSLKDINMWKKILNLKLHNTQNLQINKRINESISKNSITFTQKTNKLLNRINTSLEKIQLYIKFLRFKNNYNFITKYFNFFINFISWKKFLKFLDKNIFKYEKYDLSINSFLDKEIKRLKEEYKKIKSII